MKNGRAPGPEMIMMETVKYGGKLLIQHFTRLMNACIGQCQVPNEWKISYIPAIYKKGDVYKRQ